MAHAVKAACAAMGANVCPQGAGTSSGGSCALSPGRRGVSQVKTEGAVGSRPGRIRGTVEYPQPQLTVPLPSIPLHPAQGLLPGQVPPSLSRNPGCSPRFPQCSSQQLHTNTLLLLQHSQLPPHTRREEKAGHGAQEVQRGRRWESACPKQVPLQAPYDSPIFHSTSFQILLRLRRERKSGLSHWQGTTAA